MKFNKYTNHKHTDRRERNEKTKKHLSGTNYFGRITTGDVKGDVEGPVCESRLAVRRTCGLDSDLLLSAVYFSSVPVVFHYSDYRVKNNIRFKMLLLI